LKSIHFISTVRIAGRNNSRPGTVLQAICETQHFLLLRRRKAANLVQDSFFETHATSYLMIPESAAPKHVACSMHSPEVGGIAAYSLRCSFRTPDVGPQFQRRRGKWAEPFLSMARASRVGQAVPSLDPIRAAGLIRRGRAGEHRLPRLWAHCKFHDIRSSDSTVPGGLCKCRCPEAEQVSGTRPQGPRRWTVN
jgi:hypothetical protein